ncbi:hypothetical protein [Mesorhizobium sp. WSM3859]|uniref:hypothetical protein n=1 Tax=Mesorhizobium sp. WSM3859 TaxID=2029402 RepID=UPI000BAE80DE|nr:hypothetical protein [Mesorhizobium sp. WSM3859]PBC09456.1 hypothetical protein CK230_15100 [Mesorhizobium sp. WSM3859]
MPRAHGVAADSEALPVTAQPLGRAQNVIMVVENEDRLRLMAVEARRWGTRSLMRTPQKALDSVEAGQLPFSSVYDVIMPEMPSRLPIASGDTSVGDVLYTTDYTRNA